MKNAFRKLASIGAALGFALVAGGANAGAITFDTWTSFNFSGVIGDPLQGEPWTFDCPADHCKIIVTDGFLAIDQFEFFDFGKSIGITSVPTGGVSHTCGADPDACLADPLMSHGLFYVGAGRHSITGIVTMGDPQLPGTAFFKAVVPEPGTLLLIGAGLLGVFGLRRRA